MLALILTTISAGKGHPSDPEFAQKKVKNYTEKGDPLEHETPEIWGEIFNINISAAFFMTRAFLDLLVKGAESRNATSSVINTSSIASDINLWITVLSVSLYLSTQLLKVTSDSR